MSLPLADMTLTAVGYTRAFLAWLREPFHHEHRGS